MIKLEYPHNRLQEVLYRRKRIILTFHAVFIVVLSLSMFTKKAEAAEVASQKVNHGQASLDASTNYGSEETSLHQQLGGGFNATLTGVTIWKSATTNFPDMKLKIWCYDDSSYTTHNASCDSSTGTSDNIGSANAALTVAISSFSMNPSKYYELRVWIYNNNGPSDAPLFYGSTNVNHYLYGEATGLAAGLNGIKDLYFILHGTGGHNSQGPEDYLQLLTSGALLTSRPISYRVHYDQIPFSPSKAFFYKDSSRPQYKVDLASSLSPFASNGFDFTVTYSSTGTFIPRIVIGSFLCESASSSGTYLEPPSCNQIVIEGDPITIGDINDWFGEDVTSFTWTGPPDGPSYYASGSVFQPRGVRSDSGTMVFDWVAGTGSLYSGVATQTGSVGTGLLGPEGIFGDDLFTFTGFGTTGNAFLDIIQNLLLVVVYAAQLVGRMLFALLQYSQFFSWVVGILHPVEGSVHTIPTTLFGYANPFYPGQQFTVDYVANTGNAQNITKLVQLSIAISILGYTANHFLFTRSKHK